MQVLNQPLSKIFKLLIFSVFCVLIFNSCKKTESFSELPVQKENLVEKFFSTKTQVNEETAKIIGLLKKENEQSNFVEKLPSNCGLPIWGKIALINENNITSTNSPGISVNTNSAPATMDDIIIPLTNDNKSLSGILMAHPTATGYITGCYTIDSLYSSCHGDKIDVARANRELVLFFFFENQAFGTTDFYHIPKNLFPKLTKLDADGNKTVTIVNRPSTLSRFITVCVQVVCSICHANDPNCPLGGSWEECTTIYVPTGGGGGWIYGPTGGGSTGGGGGGGSPTGGGGTPAPCPGSKWYSRLPGSCQNVAPTLPPLSQIVTTLQNVLNLNTTQTSWLLQNSSTAIVVYQSLMESLGDENPLTNVAYIDEYSAEAIAASKITIAAAMNNLITQPLNAAHYNIVQQYIPNYQNYNYNPVVAIYFSIQCALLKIEHPEWSNWKIYWEAMKEIVHGGLDGIGLVPVIGEVADLANGIIYTIEGEGVNATLSFAAMVPIAGWGATATKYAKKAITALDGSKRTLKWLKQTNNLIHFGDRGLLRKVLGLAKGDSRIAHHIIPWEKATHPAVQKAASGNNAFHLNELLNGIPLNAVVHSGNHAAYLARVQARLDAIPTNLSPDQTRAAIEAIINDIKTAIQNNPTSHIDNLIF
jgi:A nuclease family of the HNH/ENDO VII superfamily with conserved AHH